MESQLAEVRLIIGPSGSGKRTRMNLLQDLYGFSTFSRVETEKLQHAIHSIQSIGGPETFRLAIEVAVRPFTEGTWRRQAEQLKLYIDECINRFRKLAQSELDVRLVFLYCSQERLAERQLHGFHPLAAAFGDLRAGIFTECELLIRLFRSICDDPQLERILVFSDTTEMTISQMKADLSERRYKRMPDQSAKEQSKTQRVREITESLKEKGIYTRGWNRMRETVLQLANAHDILFEDEEMELSCLLLGESGAGKEGFAKFLAECRKPIDTKTAEAKELPERPFVRLDCSTFPESLIESELFGHEAGAFTGATREKRGRVELAENGTLFLDEIGLLPLALQGKLLTLIEAREYYRIGSNECKKLKNCRIIAATSRDLESECREGRFIADLYNRLNAITITVPALRHRREDVPLLLSHLAPNTTFSDGAHALLFDYHWSGNVRELKQVAQRCEKLRESNAREQTDTFDVVVATLIEGWPQTVAKHYREAALHWRWPMLDVVRDGRERIYFETMREHRDRGLLFSDILKNLINISNEEKEVLSRLSRSENVIYAQEMHARLNRTGEAKYTDLEVRFAEGVIKELFKARDKEDDDTAMDQIRKQALSELLTSGLSISQIASLKKVAVPTVHNWMKPREEKADSAGG